MWSSGPTATCAAPTSIAPGCRAKPATGSGRTYDQMFIRHWDTWATPGVRSRLFGFALDGGKLAGKGAVLTGSAGRRHAVQAVRRRRGDRALARRPDGSISRLREAGRIEPLSTNLDIFAVPDATAARRRSI